MKEIVNLKDLFIEQGREFYDASLQELKELPGIRNHAQSPQLKKIMDRQLTVARSQSSRLKDVFKKMDVKPEGEKSECCESIFKQTKSIMNRSKDPEVRDAAIINSIQKLSHNKITSLGSLASYANEMGQKEIATSLHEALDEEKSIDLELSELAEKEVNRKAVSPMV